MDSLDSSEILYRAFRQICPQNKVSPADIKFPDISVNRGCLSKPEDLLVGRMAPVGVFSFLVGDIPTEYRSDDGKEKYTFLAIEDPQPENSAHAEVRVFINGVHCKKEPPKGVRRQFRIDLANGIKIVIPPR